MAFKLPMRNVSITHIRMQCRTACLCLFKLFLQSAPELTSPLTELVDDACRLTDSGRSWLGHRLWPVHGDCLRPLQAATVAVQSPPRVHVDSERRVCRQCQLVGVRLLLRLWRYVFCYFRVQTVVTDACLIAERLTGTLTL